MLGRMDATITTTGSGTAAAEPDAMRLHLAVAETSADVQQALDGVAVGVLRLGEVARQYTSEDRISTRGMGLWSDHERGRRTFRASQSIELSCDSFDAAGALIGALGEALGENLEIHQVQPLLTDTADLERTARARAFDDARAKAEELAGLAGRILGGVVNIVEGARGDQPYLEQGMVTASARMPFERGSMNVTAGLSVTWRLD
jgi:uncharacterized protein